jgi:hypothetical protein
MLSKYLPRHLLNQAGAPTTPPAELSDEEKAKKKAEEEAAAAKKKADEEAAAKEDESDPLLKAIIGDMRKGLPAVKPAPDAEAEAAAAAKLKADEEAAAKKKAEEEAAAAKAKEEEEAKKKAERQVNKGVIEIETEIVPGEQGDQQQQQQPQQTSLPQPTEDERYIATLSDDQREELREAEVAERLFPERYKGRKAALIAWFKRYDSEVTKLYDKDPERTLDENDQEFRTLVRSKPQLTQADNKRVLREIGAEEATAKVKKEITPKLEDIEVNQRAIAAEPRAKQASADIRKAVLHVIEEAGGPLSDAIKDKENQELALERTVIEQELELTDRLSSEYVMFANRARRFDPKNELHVRLLQFVEEQERMMLQMNDPKVLMQGNKRFTSRAQFAELAKTDQKAAEKYWTFNHRDILNMLAAEAEQRIKDRVKEELDRATKLGLVKAPKQNSPPKEKEAEKKKEEEKPKITPSRTAPAPATTPQTGGEMRELTSTLGLRRT